MDCQSIGQFTIYSVSEIDFNENEEHFWPTSYSNYGYAIHFGGHTHFVRIKTRERNQRALGIPIQYSKRRLCTLSDILLAGRRRCLYSQRELHTFMGGETMTRCCKNSSVSSSSSDYGVCCMRRRRPIYTKALALVASRHNVAWLLLAQMNTIRVCQVLVILVPWRHPVGLRREDLLLAVAVFVGAGVCEQNTQAATAGQETSKRYSAQSVRVWTVASSCVRCGYWFICCDPLSSLTCVNYLPNYTRQTGESEDLNRKW